MNDDGANRLVWGAVNSCRANLSESGLHSNAQSHAQVRIEWRVWDDVSTPAERAVSKGVRTAAHLRNWRFGRG